MEGSGSGRRIRGATVSTGPINDISIDVRRPRSGEDAREVRDRRLNTHRDRIEPCWRFWLGGHFAQLRARLARLASVDTTSDGKNRWSWLLFLLGRTSNRPIPPKISNFRLFAPAEIMRIRFFSDCPPVLERFQKPFGIDCFTPKPPKVGSELSTRIDLVGHWCPEGIVRLFSQALVLFSTTHSSVCPAPLTFLPKSPKGPLF